MNREKVKLEGTERERERGKENEGVSGDFNEIKTYFYQLYE